MLLTITTTRQPATDIGFLLHKNPARCQAFDLTFGTAHVFYPEATDARCTVALLLEVDPVGLVRKRRGPSGEGGLLDQYVNDRPYVASSLMSVAISRVFGSAMSGKCSERPELAEEAIPLETTLPVVPCRGEEKLLQQLFEPLGYTVSTKRLPLDAQFPSWGDSPYYSVQLRGQCRLSDLLTHLYVLIPVLDDEKHYWVGQDEVDKLLRHGEGWLAAHPAKKLITERYLKRQGRLTREALARLVGEEDVDPEATEALHANEETVVEEKLSLHELRIARVLSTLTSCGASRVLDLGCGEGRLLQVLLKHCQFTEVVGVDVSVRALGNAERRLKLERLAPMQRERVHLFQGALTYRDKRLQGYDAAVAMEVIEHLEPMSLPAFERALFGFAHPGSVIITTPNVEYNARFETLPQGKLRHKDHRFEWTRAAFRRWADGVAKSFGYRVTLQPIGPEDRELGPPTQMAVFTQTDPADAARDSSHAEGGKAE